MNYLQSTCRIQSRKFFRPNRYAVLLQFPKSGAWKLRVTQLLHKLPDSRLNRHHDADIFLLDKPKSLIRPVQDRLGHDRRYSLNAGKLYDLGWKQAFKFDEALRFTVQWYVERTDWWKPLKSGEYLEFYKKHYRIEL